MVNVLKKERKKKKEVHTNRKTKKLKSRNLKNKKLYKNNINWAEWTQNLLKLQEI